MKEVVKLEEEPFPLLYLFPDRNLILDYLPWTYWFLNSVNRLWLLPYLFIKSSRKKNESLRTSLMNRNQISLLSLYLLSRGWTSSPRNLGLTAFAPLPLVERFHSLAACFSRLNSRLNAEWDRTTYWWTYCYFFFLLISGGKEEGVWFLNSVFVFPWPRLDWTVRRRNLSCPCWWFLK